VHRVVVPVTCTVIMNNMSAAVEAWVVMMAVVIDYYDPAVVPVEGAEEKGGRHDNAGAPVKAGDKGVVMGVVPVHRWVVRPPPVAINNTGVIVGHVYHPLHGGLNDNDFFLPLDPDVLHLVQVARSVGLLTQVLDYIHNLRFVGEKGITDPLRPIQVIAHSLEDLGKGDQG